ncbi:MAG TPA: hypothetical protein VLS93_19200, partial [Anaeromyxobacteraceae bacterium]|nr:hypothetical protein [Anaeromyxobacteraceae bacterium]
AAAAPRPGTGSPPGQVVRARRWTIEARALYAPAREQEISLEDETEASDELNEALEDGKRLSALFGTSAPVRFQWSFEARRLPGGARVPVAVGRRGPPGSVSVTKPEVSGARSTLAVEFPDLAGEEIVEILASVTATDAFGTTGRHELRVWDTVLVTLRREGLHLGAAAESAVPVDPFLRSAEDLAGVPRRVGQQELVPQRLAAEARGPVGLRRLGAEQTRARAREVFARQALRDGVVTPEELRSLVEAAK